MKVVQVNYAYAEQISDHGALLDSYETLTGWSEALAEAGAEVQVVQAFHYDAETVRNGIRYTFRAEPSVGRGAFGGWKRPRALEAAVVAASPDVVHVNSLEFAAETWLLRRRLPRSAAVVVQDHADALPRSFSLSAAVRRRLLSAADAFLFTAEEQSEPWRTRGFFDERQLVYAVPESSTHFHPMDRATARSIAQIPGVPSLLWVGRLIAVKDPITVLHGFERVVNVLPGAALTMVFGEEDLLPAVRRRIGESPVLTDRVRLLGRVPHHPLPAFFSAADLFVLGSAREGSGYALIEACACGAVPVVTNIPSFRAMTGKGSIGVLWPQGDANAFAAAVIEMGARELDEERRRVRRHFEQHLSWPVVGRKALAIYADVRERRRARGSVPA